MKSKVILILASIIFISKLASAGIFFKEERIVTNDIESLGNIDAFVKNNLYNNNYFERIGNICYLKRPLHISYNSTFYFKGEDCAELRLYPGSYLRIGGKSFFSNIRITSASFEDGKPIQISKEKYASPRPYIYTTDEPVDYIYIDNSEFSHLGYYEPDEGSTWGLAFYNVNAGLIKNSSFHNNYFGIYSFNTKNLEIYNSSIYDNLEYGLDFHDYSDNFLIKGNRIWNNGNHALIFSKFCKNNTIEGNYIFNNTQYAFVKGITKDYRTHGIMLHEASDENTIVNNRLDNNADSIYIFKSNGNTIDKNKIISDTEHGIYLDNSSNNSITNNIVLDTSGFGLYSYYSSNNYSGNYFKKGTYFKYGEEGNEKTFRDENTFLESEKMQTFEIEEHVPRPTDFFLAKTITLAIIMSLAIIIFIVEIIYKSFNNDTSQFD